MTDWGGLRTIIDGRPKPQSRPDCPVCGEVLHFNGRLNLWSCPRWGKKHYQASSLPVA